MFIPTTPEEVRQMGWDALDVILVSGDTYIDSSYNGSAIVGHWLIKHGIRTGIIAQPDMESDDIMRLGEPQLFWSISAGCVDSLIANYTPTGKFRKDDDFTPGGVNDRRPDRACIAYSNLIKRHCKTKPIVLGGVEASLRRITHYDAWDDKVRRPILFDAKADIVTYGMSERTNLLLAQYLRDGRDWKQIKGICYIGDEVPQGYLELPAYEDCTDWTDEGKRKFIRMFRAFYYNSDPMTARGIAQKVGNRYLVQNPPYPNPTTEVLDEIYEMDFENRVHPYYARQGFVKAMDTIRNSITTHRGCYGECGFCSIALMQGRTVVSRSEDSIIREAERMAASPDFDGVIRDVGGPTANMYGFECSKKLEKGPCEKKRCMYPFMCPTLKIDHSRQIALLRRISDIPGVKKVFIASGIRYDLILADREHGEEYLRTLIRDGHISGQMKVAPEHVSDDVLRFMFKPGKDELLRFKDMFDRVCEEEDKRLYLTYYLMAAHPGCKEEHMEELLSFCHDRLKTLPEQVQIFTPSPSSPSTMMYYTRRDWDDKINIKSEHSMQLKQRQKDIILGAKSPREQKDYDNMDGDRRDDRRNGDRKPYGDRKPRYDDRGDRKPYGDRKPRYDNDRRDRKPYGDRPRYNDGDRKPRYDDGERRPRYNDDRSEGSERRGDRQYGDRKPRYNDDRGDRKPYGDRKPRYNDDRRDRKPYGDRPRYDGDRKPRYDDGDRKPRYNDDRRDRKPYGDRPRYDDSRGAEPKAEAAPAADVKTEVPAEAKETSVVETAPAVEIEKPRVSMDRRERRNFSDRNSYGRKERTYSEDDGSAESSEDGSSENGERPERRYDDRRDRKPYGDRDRKPRYNDDRRDRRSYGDRPGYNDGDRKPRYDNDRGGRKPYGDRPRRDDGDRRSYGDRDRKPRYDDRGDRKPYGDRKPRYDDDRGSRSYGDRPRYDNDRGDRKPYGDRKPRYDDDRRDRKPYGDRPRYNDGDRKPRYNDGDRKPRYNDDRRDRKPYGDRNGDYKKREYSDRPGGDFKKERDPRERKDYSNPKYDKNGMPINPDKKTFKSNKSETKDE